MLTWSGVTVGIEWLHDEHLLSVDVVLSCVDVLCKSLRTCYFCALCVSMAIEGHVEGLALIQSDRRPM